ncbi:MAG: hypothetical protein IAI49_15575 [Candidatus Eremiobacteraeota bacterium]|nr:hypothetical protein [Candidatus Eremiobacteraeota bacterium]
MNEKAALTGADFEEDQKVERDWAAVQARRADINSRDGGDTRRQAIMKRIGILGRAS